MALNPLQYIKESKAELDKVVWPTRSETIRLTITVVIVSVIIGAYITGLAALFAKVVASILKLR